MTTDEYKLWLQAEILAPLKQTLRANANRRTAAAAKLATEIATKAAARVNAYAQDVASGALSQAELKHLVAAEKKLLRIQSFELLGLSRNAAEDARQAVITGMLATITQTVALSVAGLATTREGATR